jgi:hypothetical protein
MKRDGNFGRHHIHYKEDRKEGIRTKGLSEEVNIFNTNCQVDRSVIRDLRLFQSSSDLLLKLNDVTGHHAFAIVYGGVSHYESISLKISSAGNATR